MDPIKALGKTGMLGGFLNKFDGGVELLDDLDDHWTAKSHKHERRIVIEDLQDLAADQSIRVTILRYTLIPTQLLPARLLTNNDSGDVHLAAVGQFYSNPKLGLAKHKDFRYMPNVISSAIVNTPPPDLLADVLNKRNKVHHFDKETDEDMIPVFAHGVDGGPRNNKRLLPHRNWCSIREYVPGSSPPPSPPPSEYDESPLGSPLATRPGPGGLLRRLSKSHRGPTFHGPDGAAPQRQNSRPPVSGSIFRAFSRSRRAPPGNDPSGGKLASTQSLGRSREGEGGGMLGGLFRRLSSSRGRAGGGGGGRPDDGGINGHWGDDSDGELDRDGDGDGDPTPPPSPPRMGLRGGAGEPSAQEFEQGDEDYFSVRVPQRSKTIGARSGRPVTGPAPGPGHAPEDGGGRRSPEFEPRPFHRTPTGLSTKQMKRGRDLEVNLEGGLEVCLNVEVNQRDPAGISVPYRLLVPRLWYEGEEEKPVKQGAAQGVKRWFSLKREPSVSGGGGD